MTHPTPDTAASIRSPWDRGLSPGPETAGETTRIHTRALLRRGVRHAAWPTTTTAIQKATGR